MSAAADGAGFYIGKIVARYKASPTVMILQLQIPDLLSFQPGQWLDFVVPPYKWVGGFSIASIPTELPNVTLAIKRSDHAPSTWVHETSKLDDTVHVRVGGSCTLPDDTTITSGSTKPGVVFCGGGIGISPLMSLYGQYHHLRQQQSQQQLSPPPVSFFYSVSTEEELVFGKDLVELATKHQDRLVLSVTQQSSWNKQFEPSSSSSSQVVVQYRVGRQLQGFLQESDCNSIFFLCGPPSFLDEGVQLLQKRGIEEHQIKYEKWW